MYEINSQSEGRLAIISRPRAGEWLDKEIIRWKDRGLEVVISLLEHEEVVELGLQREAAQCAALGIEFISYPIIDRGVPSSRMEAAELCESAAHLIGQGRFVAFHCRAGIGRSAVMAACTLICSGVAATQALADVGKARGLDVPDTEEQLKWILAFARGDNETEQLRKQVFR